MESRGPSARADQPRSARGARVLARREALRGLALAVAAGIGVLAAPAPTRVRAANSVTRLSAAVDSARLERKLNRLMADYDVPGAAVGVIFEDAAFTTAAGVTNRRSPEPATPQTLFGIASITKVHTALTAMRLVDQGLLDLDAPIRRYLPTIKLARESTTAQLTMRHLLSHTSGLARDYTWPDFGPGDDARARLVEAIADVKISAQPGRRYAYSNVGLDLAGRVIEVVAGAPYESAVRSLVLDPLDMSLSTFFPSEAAGRSISWGHEGKRNRPVPPFACSRAENSDGGLASSADDQLHFARFWLGDGTAPSGARLLARPLFDEMLTPRVAAEDGWSVGVGWFVVDVDGSRVISHEGFFAGFASDLTIVPDRGFALIVLTNADAGYELASDLSAWALEQYLGIVIDAED